MSGLECESDHQEDGDERNADTGTLSEVRRRAALVADHVDTVDQARRATARAAELFCVRASDEGRAKVAALAAPARPFSEHESTHARTPADDRSPAVSHPGAKF